MTNDFNVQKNNPSLRLSKEEYVEKKKAEKDAIYKLIDDTAKQVVNDPTKFADFLDTQSKFDRYSATNTLLIYAQNPGATQLKDFTDWTKDNVKIKKGTKSISILEPIEYA